MNSSSKITPILLIALLVVGSVSAHAAPQTARELLFRGSIETTETHVVTFPIIKTELSGAGNASQLGKYSMTMTATINLLTRTAVGFAAFTAANGDLLNTAVAGQAMPTGNPDEVSIVEVHTIIGGTGRFVGATGQFELTRINDSVALAGAGDFEGTIVLPIGKP